MISMIRPLHIGNAIQLLLTPPAGAKLWRVLRKGSNDIVNQTDPAALVAYEGCEKCVVDTTGLINGVLMYYAVFYFDGLTWFASDTASVTPRADYEDHTTDVFSFVRDRLDAGLAVETQRKTLNPSNGYIQVLTAPPVVEGSIQLPLLTIHLQSEASSVRGIGEVLTPDEFDIEGDFWDDDEGYLAQVSIEIAAWSLNPDERIELRKAVRRIILANYAVFESVGMINVSLQQQDIDSLAGEYGAPIYQSVSILSCEAPVKVGGRIDPVRVIQSNIVKG